ncbi:MAG TPA: Clp protease N-terminal domain-containing protein, partial [Hyphomicrobiaceae bacterium]|nr:Clp protease N-terminal domain-containing protein [Hyphomicrobiaceae bacterium]
MPQSFADELRSIPVSPSLGESLQRAYGFARDQALPAVTLEHLLLALTQDPESLPLLEAGNVDMTRLSADASSYLGRLMENGRQGEPGAEPRADPELLRVLQAAASATTKSPRRYIDGSIVLAAVVGDGKSPAAGLLKAHGLTFEHAIRALQQANAKARTRQFSTQAQQRPAPTLAAETRPEERPATERPEPSPPASRFTTEVPGGGAQSAEDILAAARARIQQRAASAANRGEAPAPAPKPVESRMPSAAATPASPAPPAAPAPPDEPAPQQPMAAQPVAAPAQPAAAPAPAPPPPAPEFQAPQPVAPVPGPPRPQPRPPDSPGRVLGRPVRPGEGPP